MTKSLLRIFWGISLVLLLAACSSQTLSSKLTATPTHPPVTATPDLRSPTPTKVPVLTFDEKALNGVQIVFLHPWSGEAGRVVDVLVDEFNQTNQWGIHVITWEPGSLGQAIEQMQNESSELSIDVASLPVYEFLKQDEASRPVVDLNPYVFSSTFGLSEKEIKDYYPVFWNANILDGKLFGIPAQQTAAVLFYNSTWAQELGYTQVPLTTTNFKIQACAANAILKTDQDRQNDGMGGWIIDENALTFYSWLSAFDAIPFDQPNVPFDTVQSQKTFEYLFELQKNACAWSSRLPEPYDYFANRQTILFSGTLQDILPQSEAFMRSGLNDQWRVILYPTNFENNLIIDGLSFGIFESDPTRQMAAWYFIRWISQPDQQARLIQTTGTFPLTKAVLGQLTDFKESYPQWAEAVTLIPYARSIRETSDATIRRTVLADGGTFLFRPEFTVEKIPELLHTMDETISELERYQP